MANFLQIQADTPLTLLNGVDDMICVLIAEEEAAVSGVSISVEICAGGETLTTGTMTQTTVGGENQFLFNVPGTTSANWPVTFHAQIKLSGSVASKPFSQYYELWLLDRTFACPVTWRDLRRNNDLMDPSRLAKVWKCREPDVQRRLTRFVKAAWRSVTHKLRQEWSTEILVKSASDLYEPVLYAAMERAFHDLQSTDEKRFRKTWGDYESKANSAMMNTMRWYDTCYGSRSRQMRRPMFL